MLLKLNLKKIGFHIDQTSKVVVIVFLDILKLFIWLHFKDFIDSKQPHNGSNHDAKYLIV
jgi:hypothetical protein